MVSVAVKHHVYLLTRDGYLDLRTALVLCDGRKATLNGKVQVNVVLNVHRNHKAYQGQDMKNPGTWQI